MAKYTLCGSIFSGRFPLSAIIRIDSPFCNSWPPWIVNIDLLVAVGLEWVAINFFSEVNDVAVVDPFDITMVAS